MPQNTTPPNYNIYSVARPIKGQPGKYKINFFYQYPAQDLGILETSYQIDETEELQYFIRMTFTGNLLAGKFDQAFKDFGIILNERCDNVTLLTNPFKVPPQKRNMATKETSIAFFSQLQEDFNYLNSTEFQEKFDQMVKYTANYVSLEQGENGAYYSFEQGNYTFCHSLVQCYNPTK